MNALEKKLLKLITRYQQNLVFHTHYERDVRLGKDHQTNIDLREKSKENLQKLRKEVGDIQIKLELQTEQKLLGVLSEIKKTGYLYDAQQKGLKEELLQRDQKELLGYLKKHEKKTGRYFDDDLSDDSDTEDEKKLQNNRYTENDNFKLIENSSNNRKKRKFLVKNKDVLKTFDKQTKKVGKRKAPKKTMHGKPVNSGILGQLQYVVYEDKKNRKKGNNLKSIVSETAKRISKITNKLKSNLKERGAIALDNFVDQESKKKAQKKTIKKIKADLKGFNKLLKTKKPREFPTTKELQQANITTEFVVAGYRGDNYMLSRWSPKARRYHRKMNERGKIKFCEMILKTLPYDYFNDLDENHDPLKNNSEYLKLNQKAEELIKFHAWLKRSEPSVGTTGRSEKDNGDRFLFNNIGYHQQNNSSNGIDAYLLSKQKKRKNHPNFWGHFYPSAHNPTVAVGERPRHPLEYAFGRKGYYRYSLTPRYSCDGTISYPHVGKVYISLHSLSEIVGNTLYSPNRLGVLTKQGENDLQQDIEPEKENNFGLKLSGIFAQFVAKFPSFKKYNAKVHKRKYGLDEKLFDAFQYLIRVSKPNTRLRNTVINLMGEWLCSYYEVLLIDIAAKEAHKQNKVLVYLNNNNELSFDPDNGSNLTCGDKYAPLRNSIHTQREIRKSIGKTLHEDNVNTNTVPGYQTIPKNKGKRLAEEMRDDEQSLLQISAYYRSTKEEESKKYSGDKAYAETNLKIQHAKQEIEKFIKNQDSISTVNDMPFALLINSQKNKRRKIEAEQLLHIKADIKQFKNDSLKNAFYCCNKGQFGYALDFFYKYSANDKMLSLKVVNYFICLCKYQILKPLLKVYKNIDVFDNHLLCAISAPTDNLIKSVGEIIEDSKLKQNDIADMVSIKEILSTHKRRTLEFMKNEQSQFGEYRVCMMISDSFEFYNPDLARAFAYMNNKEYENALFCFYKYSSDIKNDAVIKSVVGYFAYLCKYEMLLPLLKVHQEDKNAVLNTLLVTPSACMSDIDSYVKDSKSLGENDLSDVNAIKEVLQCCKAESDIEFKIVPTLQNNINDDEDSASESSSNTPIYMPDTPSVFVDSPQYQPDVKNNLQQSSNYSETNNKQNMRADSSLVKKNTQPYFNDTVPFNFWSTSYSEIDRSYEQNDDQLIPVRKNHFRQGSSRNVPLCQTNNTQAHKNESSVSQFSVFNEFTYHNYSNNFKSIPRGLPRAQNNGGLSRGRSVALPLDRARGFIPRAKFDLNLKSKNEDEQIENDSNYSEHFDEYYGAPEEMEERDRDNLCDYP